MNENSGAPDPVNRMEASLAVRKADREATSHTGDLADRLAEVDLHQREARYLLERIPELRPWRWFVATVVCMIASGYTPAWATVVLVTAGLCCFFQALSSYYKGNDGLSQYRQ